jgi:hypothetical protein
LENLVCHRFPRPREVIGCDNVVVVVVFVVVVVVVVDGRDIPGLCMAIWHHRIREGLPL